MFDSEDSASCLLKIAIYADAIKKGKTFIKNVTHQHYRIELKLCDILSHVLGCQYEVVYPEDGEFGSFSNGSWTGMIGMVYRGDADLAISDLAITEERQQVVDFSYPFSVTRVTFATEQLKFTYDIATFLKPFSLEVWSCLGLFQLAMPFISYFLFFKTYSFSKIALKSFATFLGQLSLKPSQKTSGRIIIIFWMIFMMIMSFTYKAIFFSILTFPVLDGIRVISELSAEVEKGKYECTTFPGTFYANHLLKSSIKPWKIIGQNLLKNGGSSNIVKALENIGNKKTAFIGSEINFIHIKNKYFISEDFFFIELPAIVMKKNFPYKKEVNKAIHRMYASGLFHKILEDERFSKVLQNLADFGPQNIETVTVLSLEHVYSVFFLLLIGYILAFCCFIVEISCPRNVMKGK